MPTSSISMTRKHGPVGFGRLARAASGGLGAALVASLVACGSDDEPSVDSSNPSTPDQDERSGRGGVRQPTEAAGKIDPQEFVDKLSAGLDASTTAQVTMSVNSTAQTMSATGAVDYTGDTPSMALKMTSPEMGEGTIDIRMIDQVIYMSMPMLDTSGKFFKIDLNDPDNPLANSRRPGRVGPEVDARDFGKGVTSVKVTGNETIDGAETTHYLVTSDSKYLTKSLGGSKAGVDLPKEFNYEIWLDGEGRMRRLISDMGKQSSVEMQMTDWGEPVDIDVPPADQIQQMPRT